MIAGAGYGVSCVFDIEHVDVCVGDEGGEEMEQRDARVSGLRASNKGLFSFRRVSELAGRTLALRPLMSRRISLARLVWCLGWFGLHYGVDRVKRAGRG